jgi:predicted site-specific integrase-resolvase
MAANDFPQLLQATVTDEEIAELYGLSLRTVKRWAALGKLPKKVGPSKKPRRNLEAVRRALTGEGKAA